MFLKGATVPKPLRSIVNVTEQVNNTSILGIFDVLKVLMNSTEIGANIVATRGMYDDHTILSQCMASITLLVCWMCGPI